MYRDLVTRYAPISLVEERRLIRLAKRGCEKSEKEIVLRHVNFVMFRIRRKLFPEYLRKFGEDLLEESILVLYQKVRTYNLRYYDKNGNFKPVKFASYIWKRIDGHIIDFLNEQSKREKFERKQVQTELACYAEGGEWDARMIGEEKLD